MPDRDTVFKAIIDSLLEQWATDTHADPEKTEGARKFWVARAEAVTDSVMEALEAGPVVELFKLPTSISDTDREIGKIVVSAVTAMIHGNQRWAEQLLDEAVEIDPRQAVIYSFGMALGLLANQSEESEVPIEVLWQGMSMQSTRVLDGMEADDAG